MMTGLEVNRVLQGLEILEDQLRGPDRTLNLVKDYSYENVSHKVKSVLFIVIQTMLIE